MRSPADYPRRILLAVTGLSPQIVTETLYALGTASRTETAFGPTEVHVVTTGEGARLIRAALLHADGGQFHALLADYPVLGRPAFGDSNIHVILQADGTPLADIRTPTENACAADTITSLVAALTRDAEAALHVSIAGGRKTMGFYLGYAFSLFARPQDRLSHVLVSPPFESHPDFFFPPATPRRLSTRDGRHVDTADAVVTLAEIPVVRLRHGMPLALQQGKAGFSETVRALQESFAPPRLDIDLGRRQAICGDRAVMLPPALLAWFAWWADAALRGTPFQRWDQADAATYLRIYARVVGLDAAKMEAAQRRLKDGMEKAFFEESNAKLHRLLRDQLGPGAQPYLLTKQGKRGQVRRGLSLPPGAITLIA